MQDFIWEIYRDGKLCAAANSHRSAERIIRSLQSSFPASQFTVRYVGRSIAPYLIEGDRRNR